jgi:hypothetical protein
LMRLSTALRISGIVIVAKAVLIGVVYPTLAPSWARYGDEESAIAGMNEREEEEEFFLAFGTRKHRNAIKERRKARQQEQKPTKGAT